MWRYSYRYRGMPLSRVHQLDVDMNKFKINLHCHTHFSDGCNSPFVMAQQAKELGFCCFVMTDHFYTGTDYEADSMRWYKWNMLQCAKREISKLIMPVIVGLEVGYESQEVLVFGTELIKDILRNEKFTFDMAARHLEYRTAGFVLCHPGANYDKALKICQGYEHFNSGNDYFKTRSPSLLANTKTTWSNSDAHSAEHLARGYNLVNEKITTEKQLIRYLHSGDQPELYHKREDIKYACKFL